jgi:hypothetical protein
MATLAELSAPVRDLAHHSAVMILCSNRLPPHAKIADITAILEGTMAAAIQVLGARDAFDIIQPLVDKVLNPAIAATIERN